MSFEQLDSVKHFAEAYAALAVNFAYFYVSIYDTYLANIDVASFVREAVFVNLGLLSDLFTDVDLVDILNAYYENYILYPYTCVEKGVLYLTSAYASCFETEFIMSLDKKIRLFMCDVLNKPNFVDKNAWYIFFMDDVVAPKKVITNPLAAEIFAIIGLIGGATVYFIVLGYFTGVLIYGSFLILAFITRSIFGYNQSDDETQESASNFVESEKELGSIDDFMFVFVGLALIYSLYFGIFLLYSCGIQAFLFALSKLGFPLLVSAAISLPICFIYDCGLGFVAYLRGSGNTTIFALEFLYDTLATAIMFIRLSIQNVRFLLIFFAYFEAFEFLNAEFFLNERSWAFFQAMYSNVQSADSVTAAFYIVLLDFPRIVIHGIYILGHLFYTFVSNFVCFIVLMFWFFSFLYTMFYNEKMEYYLKKKRASYSRLMASF